MENQEILQVIKQMEDNLLGHLGDVENRMNERVDAMENRMNERFDAMENRMNERFDAVEKRFDAMEKRLDAMENRLDVLDVRFGALEKKYGALELAYASLAEDITAIRMEIENEIRPNVLQISEGHSGLLNEFQAARIHEDNIEVLSVRTRYLESKMREMEAKLVNLQKAV